MTDETFMKKYSDLIAYIPKSERDEVEEILDKKFVRIMSLLEKPVEEQYMIKEITVEKFNLIEREKVKEAWLEFKEGLKMYPLQIIKAHEFERKVGIKTEEGL